MSISQFAFNPPTGWRDRNRFPTYESEEEQVREDMQDLHDQVRDYINGTIVAKWNDSKAEQAALLPTSGANMKYLRRNTTSNVIETSTDGTNWTATANSGHVILDGNGNAAPQRSRLRFMGATVTDADGATVVHSLDVISTATETALEGVLMGDGSNITAVPLETELSMHTYPIASVAVRSVAMGLQRQINGVIISCSLSGVNELPITVSIINAIGETVPDLTANHVPIDMELSNPDAQVDDWEVTTGASAVTISGEIFGETDITLTFDLPYSKTASPF